MVRRILGPFPELAGLSEIDIAAAYAGDAQEELVNALHDRMQLVHDVLVSAGCQCVGHAGGALRDADWGGDIGELVTRCGPHNITEYAEDGTNFTSSVKLDLASLRVEVDDNNELCAWLYEEH
jgi:hypothetical protein